MFSPEKQRYLSKAERLIKDHLAYGMKHEKKEHDSQFLLGNGGLYTVCIMIDSALSHPTKHGPGRNRKSADRLVGYYAEALQKVLKVNYMPKGGDEVLVGRAGYLFGILNLRKKLGYQVISDAQIMKVMSTMLDSGREGSYTNPVTFRKRVDPQAEADVKASVDFLVKIQQKNGNIAVAMDELGGVRAEEDELVHWCHGAPGVIYLMAKAYLIWKEQRHLDCAVKCGQLIWERGLLKKGPGVCHGIAGNAYGFLALYQLTGTTSYLTKAHRFAAFLDSDEFKKNARTPDSPYSLYEGLAGTLCLYVDLMRPESWEFPLFPL